MTKHLETEKIICKGKDLLPVTWEAGASSEEQEAVLKRIFKVFLPWVREETEGAGYNPLGQQAPSVASLLFCFSRDSHVGSALPHFMIFRANSHIRLYSSD